MRTMCPAKSVSLGHGPRERIGGVAANIRGGEPEVDCSFSVVYQSDLIHQLFARPVHSIPFTQPGAQDSAIPGKV